MWLWCGVGAVVWVVVSIAVALLIGRMVRRADSLERVHPPTPTPFPNVVSFSHDRFPERGIPVS